MNIAEIAPVLGITEGEQNVGGRVRTERLGLHVLYGFVTALVTEALSRRLSATSTCRVPGCGGTGHATPRV